MALKLGDSVYLINTDRHTYRQTRDYRDAIEAIQIREETSQRWIVGGYKWRLPKDFTGNTWTANHMMHGPLYLDYDTVLNQVWLLNHRHAVSEAIRDCKDVNLLKSIAIQLGLGDLV